jgi:glycosyltransferase involved in cell wall biosynthesis
MLVLPSRFDTFGCVVLEAMSCATPVAAYSVKGPKDIIQHGVNGFLATDKESLSQCLYDYFNTPEKHSRFRQQAFLHSKDYHAEKILTQFLEDLKWQESTGQMAPTNPADGFNIENTYVENS